MKTPVVYTMGKVASSAITKGIRDKGLVVHDIHTLNDETLLRETRGAMKAGEFPPPHICTSMAWKTREITAKTRSIYISLVREPIGRNLSAFFQNKEKMLAGFEGGEEDRGPALFEHFLKTYPHDFPTKWFDREFREYLGIDIYDAPFNKKAKYKISHNQRVVLFRVDCPDSVKSRVLSEVMGRRIRVERTNDSSDKDYLDDYSSVKSVAKFPAEILDQVYDTKFARHFWTEDEIAEFRERWQA